MLTTVPGPILDVDVAGWNERFFWVTFTPNFEKASKAWPDLVELYIVYLHDRWWNVKDLSFLPRTYPAKLGALWLAPNFLFQTKLGWNHHYEWWYGQIIAVAIWRHWWNIFFPLHPRDVMKEFMTSWNDSIRPRHFCWLSFNIWMSPSISRLLNHLIGSWSRYQVGPSL